MTPSCTGMAPTFDCTIAGETPTNRAARLEFALAICQGCPMWDSCADYARKQADTAEPVEGVWAGEFHEPDFEKRKRERDNATRRERRKAISAGRNQRHSVNDNGVISCENEDGPGGAGHAFPDLTALLDSTEKRGST